jgi:hypothetical protein
MMRQRGLAIEDGPSSDISRLLQATSGISVALDCAEKIFRLSEKFRNQMISTIATVMPRKRGEPGTGRAGGVV